MTLRADQDDEQEDTAGRTLRRERPDNTLERRIRLPEGLDPDEVSVRLREGILRVEAPQRPRGRVIEVGT